MKMDVGLDTGPMLSKRAIRHTAELTTGSAIQALSQLGADLLIDTLPDYVSGKLIPQPQPEAGSTYAPMLKKEDGLLDFTHPAVELERRVRAMDPWPGAWFEWNGSVLKVGRAFDGALVLDEVQPAGKKMMPGKSFLAGTKNWES